jgi:hypothetical protein
MRIHAMLNQLRSLISEADEAESSAALIQEKDSKHWPFKSKAHLGPGPRGGENDKTDNWECNCSSYNCTCKGIGPNNKGKTRKVRINKSYKAAYNKEYKKWRKAKGF